MVVLDTSALSAVMHRLPEALDRLGALDPSEVVLCTPALAEIHFGLERLPARSKRRRLLAAELALLQDHARVHDWTEPAARRFGAVKAVVETKGQRIDDMDVAIAALALELRASVGTCNTRHFARVPELVVEDWSI